MKLKKIKLTSVLVILFFVGSIIAQTPTQNYIHTYTPLSPVASENAIYTLSQSLRIDGVNYFDGIGRLVQQVNSKTSPLLRDEISFTEYDSTGRVKKNYLSFTNSNVLGPLASYRSNAVSLQQTYYNTAQSKFKTNTKAFSEVNFDNSPLDLIKETSSPSPSWALSTGKTFKQDYSLNINSAILIWEATSYGAICGNANILAYYNAKELLATTVTNEENHTITSYTDKAGRLICDVELIDASTSKYNYTYYVYNDFGELTCVISPLGYDIMVQNNDYATSGVSQLIFLYEYDKRGRLIKSKVPNKGWEYNVYNDLDQLVFSQNEKMRASNLWFFNKYDKQGRVILSGLHTNTSTPIALQSNLDANLGTLPLFEKRTNANYSTQFGYTNGALPASNIEIQLVNYYDDYDFNYDGTDDYSPDLTPITFINTPGQYTNAQTVSINTSDRTAGLLTGTKVKVLETSPAVPFLTTSIFYDEKARVVETRQNNYANGYDINCVNYDFSGKILFSETRHLGYYNKNVKSTYRMYYDKVGRVQSIISKNNNDPVVIIAKNKYNEISQLVEKNIHSTNGTSYLQSVDFTYNEVGLLTHMNNADLVSNDPTNNNDDTNDLFGFELKYNNPVTGISNVNAKYDGSVSEFHWKSISDSDKKAYACEYDLKNRLTNATHTQYYGMTNQYLPLQKYDEFGMSYDANGNISTLKRNGYQQNSSFGLMDDLTFSYHGNQLINVYDAATMQGYNDFKPMGSNSYSYDVNGNLTSDPSKNITISYNHLDLPTQITAATGSLQFVYDAEGNLLKRTCLSGNPNSPTLVYNYYINNFIYDGSSLKYFSQPEGLVVPDLSNSGKEYRHEYAYTDHLGNTRLCYSDLNFDNTITPSTEVLQENSFYPFGLDMYGLGKTQIGAVNNFKLNGAEYYPELNVNLDNFGPRNYDPALGRWLSIDPLAETTPGWTPYRFGLDNPMNFNDPSGMSEYEDDLSKGNTTMLGDDGFGAGSGNFDGDGDPKKKMTKVNDSKGGLYTYTDENGGKRYCQKCGDLNQNSSSKGGDSYNGPTISQGNRSALLQSNAVYAFQNWGGDGTGGFSDNAMKILNEVRDWSPLTQLNDAANIFLYGRDSRGIAKNGVDATYSMFAGLVSFVGMGSELNTSKNLLFKVGTYRELKTISKNSGLDAHHVGQAAGMKKFIPNYVYKDAPAILVPVIGHRKGVGILSKSIEGLKSARSIVARDILELRRVYNVPNSQLQKLIDLNKKMYPQIKNKIN